MAHWQSGLNRTSGRERASRPAAAGPETMRAVTTRLSGLGPNCDRKARDRE